MATEELCLHLPLPPSGGRLGLRISPANDVLDVDPEGLAASSGLEKGDRIVEIDGNSLFDTADGSIATATALLRRTDEDPADAERELIILRRARGSEHIIITIPLSRDGGGSLGFNVAADNSVSALKPNGAAELAGLCIGDRVVEVDESPLPDGARLGAIMPKARADFVVGIVRSSATGSSSKAQPPRPSRRGGLPPASLSAAPPPSALANRRGRDAVARDDGGGSDYYTMLSDAGRSLLTGGNEPDGTAARTDRSTRPPSGGAYGGSDWQPVHRALLAAESAQGSEQEARQAPPARTRLPPEQLPAPEYLPSRMRVATFPRPGTVQLVVAPLPDETYLAPREILLRVICASISERDAQQWATANEPLRALRASIASSAKAGVWQRSLPHHLVDARQVACASAVAAEVLRVGSLVKDFRAGDLAVLAGPPARANAAALGSHRGWHRSLDGLNGVPLASMLVVPEDSALESGLALAKVPTPGPTPAPTPAPIAPRERARDHTAAAITSDGAANLSVAAPPHHHAPSGQIANALPTR